MIRTRPPCAGSCGGREAKWPRTAQGSGKGRAVKPAADVYHLAGLLTVTAAVIAMGEVFRLARWLDVLLGLGAAVVPWFLPGTPLSARVAGALTGLAIAALAVPRGRSASVTPAGIAS